MAAIGGSGVAGRVGDNPKEIRHLGEIQPQCEDEATGGGTGPTPKSSLFLPAMRVQQSGDRGQNHRDRRLKWDPLCGCFSFTSRRTEETR